MKEGLGIRGAAIESGTMRRGRGSATRAWGEGVVVVVLRARKLCARDWAITFKGGLWMVKIEEAGPLP